MDCRECGKPSDSHKYKGLNIPSDLCFRCDFWLGHISRKDEPESIRINGEHYRLSTPLWEENPQKREFLGFAGRVFLIHFNDGRVVKTNNLWHQGTIPERFRNRLPDNAHFEAL
jgi:hypothetical protein